VVTSAAPDARPAASGAALVPSPSSHSPRFTKAAQQSAPSRDTAASVSKAMQTACRTGPTAAAPGLDSLVGTGYRHQYRHLGERGELLDAPHASQPSRWIATLDGVGRSAHPDRPGGIFTTQRVLTTRDAARGSAAPTRLARRDQDLREQRRDHLRPRALLGGLDSGKRNAALPKRPGRLSTHGPPVLSDVRSCRESRWGLVAHRQKRRLTVLLSGSADARGRAGDAARTPHGPSSVAAVRLRGALSSEVR